MARKLDFLISEARKAAVAIRNLEGDIRVVSHYDADGIAAASIISIALAREGKRFRLSVIKQLSEQKVKALADEKNGLTIFTDLGSGHLRSIQESLLFPGSKVIILDHHQAKGDVLPGNSENLVHANPLIFGINENLSGAGVAYLLAKEIDPENMDLSYLGVIGAVGDSQAGSIEEGWGLSGPNKEILKDAKKSGKISVSRGLRIWGRRTRPIHKALEYCTDPLIPGVSGSESASVQLLTELGIPLKNGGEWRTLSDLSPEEQRTLASGIIKQRLSIQNPHDIFGDIYEIEGHPDGFRSVEEFATVLNACGKLGRHGTGIAMCMGNPSSFGDALELLSDYRKDVGKALSWLRESSHAIRTTERGTYMLAGSRVSEHIISNIVSIFSKSGFVPGDRPVFAFADAEEGMVKVSARAHDLLVEKGMNMERLVSEAASRLGGEGGGHKGAAGATIPRESQDAFISCIEEMLAGQPPENNINTTVPHVLSCDKPEGRRPGKHAEKTPSIDNYGTAETERGEDCGRKATWSEGGTGERRCQRAPSDQIRLPAIAAFRPERGASGDEGSQAGTEDRQPETRRTAIRQAGAAEGSRFQKMEGQGLVRYFGPKDVQ
ncbi:MAG TPA: DHH family phosphoesterase [archaeon]|nr:DHH family phosphoesterase [archaeon]